MSEQTLTSTPVGAPRRFNESALIENYGCGH
jgi:hypothetical protein